MPFDSPFFGVGLIVAGIIYLIKPDIFQRWWWKRTAISQKVMTPEQNKFYMRVLGLVFIIAGIVILVR